MPTICSQALQAQANPCSRTRTPARSRDSQADRPDLQTVDRRCRQHRQARVIALTPLEFDLLVTSGALAGRYSRGTPSNRATDMQPNGSSMFTCSLRSRLNATEVRAGRDSPRGWARAGAGRRDAQGSAACRRIVEAVVLLASHPPGVRPCRHASLAITVAALVILLVFGVIAQLRTSMFETRKDAIC